jgi:pilus assembly protein CpaC
MQRILRRLLTALWALTFLVASASFDAKASELSHQIESKAKSVALGVGKSVGIDLPEDAAEILVADPKVANAVVRSARKLYVIGMANGQTTLFAMDAEGRRILNLEISIGRDIGELQQILHIAMPKAAIIARTVNDSIILTGIVDSAEEAQRAADIAKGFTKDTSANGATSAEGLVVNSLVIRGRDEVTLKVTIAEMRRDIAKQLGVTSSAWGPFTGTNSFAINGPLSANSGVTLQNPTGTLSATLQAFERQNVARVLAEPTVSAISGESAKFTVGGEFPYSAGVICGTTGSSACTAGGAAFKDYGITLNFSPIVLAEGRILLHIATEDTEIDFTNSVVISGVPTPGLRTRKNEATVELPSGSSIATGGLLQTTTSAVIQGFPGLMNLPILGTLFRSRDYQRDETELMIIVTAYIAKSVAPQALARPDDGFADSSDPQAWLLGRINRLYASPGNPEAAQNYKGRFGFIQD